MSGRALAYQAYALGFISHIGKRLSKVLLQERGMGASRGKGKQEAVQWRGTSMVLLVQCHANC